MVFNTLNQEKAIKTLLSSQPDVQRVFVRSLSMKRIANLLEVMPSHEAADLLNLMPLIHNRKVLKLMKPGIAAKVQKILSYEKRTAGAMMSTMYISIPLGTTVQEAIDIIRKDMPRTRHATYIYVCDNDGVMKGIVSSRDLLISERDEKVENIMLKDFITVPPEKEVDDIRSTVPS